MTDTADLATWLRQQFDEDERTARAVLWDGSGNTLTWELSASATIDVGTDSFYAGDRTIANHIVAHDPARVLASVAAKREMIGEPVAGSIAEPDAELHARFAHPYWEYATTQGQRKQWGDADVPPLDEDYEPDYTWERNIDAGIDGWMRHDYTEESYWRRRRATPRPPDQPPRWLRLLAAEYADRPGYRTEWRP